MVKFPFIPTFDPILTCLLFVPTTIPFTIKLPIERRPPPDKINLNPLVALPPACAETPSPNCKVCAAPKLLGTGPLYVNELDAVVFACGSTIKIVPPVTDPRLLPILNNETPEATDVAAVALSLPSILTVPAD